MDFVTKSTADTSISTEPSNQTSVIASQTWTRKLRCTDPTCQVDHAGGSQHEWDKQETSELIGADSDEVPYVCPADRIVEPLDVISPTPEIGEECVCVIGTRGVKVTRIAGLEYLSNSLQELVLRSNLIASMEGVQSLRILTKLELYDNQIENVSHVEDLKQLKILDLSYNSIRSMAPVSACPLLEELYLAQNKLKEIEGVAGLVHLKCLDLGANRIRSMGNAGLSTLCSLQSLWLGKNKIEVIEDINDLPNLRQFDCQNNRLTTLNWEGSSKGIYGLKRLEELYLACNAISDLQGLPRDAPLSTLDLSTNKINTLEGIQYMTHLNELWMTAADLAMFEQLEPLKALLDLECLYLEHSPLSRDFEYRMRVTSMLPSLRQLDATAVNRRV